MGVLAEKLGLRCVDEKEGVFHLPVNSDADNEVTLNKMSEIERNGFHYRGIQNMVGHESVMIFSFE